MLRCYGRLGSCGPPVAFWYSRIGNRAPLALCQCCLDRWFDLADDDPALEPVAWGWLRERQPA